MLKVLLADDERIILRGLHKLVDWRAFDMEIIGEAYSGTELLQMIQDLQPDLVISDIVMPGMTGIDVLKLIKDQGIHTYVIFLSAFREFAYAQEALALGAVDYILKPIDQMKLEQAILKALAILQEASHSKVRFGRLAHLEQQHSKSQEKEWFQHLIDGERLDLTVQALTERFVEKSGSRYSVLIVEREDILNNQGNWEGSGWKLLQFAIQNVVEDTLSEDGRGWVMIRQEKICIVFCHDSSTDTESIASRLHDRLSAYLRVKVTIGLSSSTTLENLSLAYKEAVNAAGYRFFLGARPFISYENIPGPKLEGISSRDAVEKDLLQAVLSSTPVQISSLCGEWLEAVICEAWGNRDIVVHSSYALLHVISYQLSDLGYDTEFRDEQELTQRLWSFETCHELGIFIQEEMLSLMTLAGPRENYKEASQLEGIKKYLAEHFHEDLKLESMAALMYMNTSYFSTFFKKHTGKNFKQYLTELRMKEGHRLLLQSDLMVYEVAEAVGYNNPRQFSDMFRKYYGKLPNDYRLQ